MKPFRRLNTTFYRASLIAPFRGSRLGGAIRPMGTSIPNDCCQASCSSGPRNLAVVGLDGSTILNQPPPFETAVPTVLPPQGHPCAAPAAGGPAGAAPIAASSYQCSSCLKPFRLLNAIVYHIKTKHNGDAKAIALGPDGQPLPEGSQTQTSSATPAAAAAGAATPGPTAGATASAPSGTTTISDATKLPGSTPAPEPVPEQTEKLFVCSVCQKAFRLEAALQHHYLVKHNMDSPTSATASATPKTSEGAASGQPAAPTGTTTITDSTPQAPASHQYARSAEPVEPQPPQYHLEVAPNAPEESEIAVHSMCVNRISLVGEISELATGYVFEEPAVQFTLATDFEKPHVGDPDKDFHTVRVLGRTAIDRLRPILQEGNRVMVSGRLRLIPQYESSVSKFYHFPVVLVENGSASIHLLQTAQELEALKPKTDPETPSTTSSDSVGGTPPPSPPADAEQSAATASASG
jgi:hypothetical protein